MGFDVPVCLARAARRGTDPSRTCAAPVERVLPAGAHEAELRAARGFSEVTVVDLSRELCGAAACEPMRGDLVMYRDDHHLSTTFAATLSEPLGASLAAILESDSKPHAEPAPGPARPSGTP
jgi:hypothetical protein